MKAILLTFLFLAIVNNTFCQKIQVLTIEDNKPFYYEKNEFTVTTYDSTVMVTQAIDYIPGIPDSNRNYLSLDLFFNSPMRAIKQKKLNIVNDTSIIKSSFYLNSADYDKKRDSISGNIVVLSWGKRIIKLLLNIKVLDSISKKTYVYSGIRDFIRSNRAFSKE